MKLLECPLTVFIAGTPIINRLIDLIGQLDILWRESFRQEGDDGSLTESAYVDASNKIIEEYGLGVGLGFNAAIKPLLEEQARRQLKTLLRVLLFCS